ncbi:MAG: hypothetical protein RLY14_1386 [Planctomycetota bacterium]|jgi:hypothetical protein
MSSSSSDDNPFSTGETSSDGSNPFGSTNSLNPFGNSKQENPFLPPVLPPGKIEPEINQQPRISFTTGFKASIVIASILCMLSLAGGVEMISLSIFAAICAVMGAFHKPLRIRRRRRLGLVPLPPKVSAPDFWLSSLLSCAITLAGAPVFLTVCTISVFGLEAINSSAMGDLFLYAMIFSGSISVLVIFFLYFLTLRI